MYLDFTEEQQMIAQMAREFAEREIAPLDEDYDFNRPLTNPEYKEIWSRLQPAFANVISDMDLSDLDFIAIGLFVEEIFKANPSLVCTVGMALAPAGMIYMYGNEEQKERFVPPILAGRKIGCTAITEPDVGSNPAAIQTTAVREGDSYIVNGTKTWISNGSISDVVALICRFSDGDDLSMGTLMVDREESPYETNELPHIGLKAFPTSELFFTDCPVPAANRLGGGNPGRGKGSKGLSMVFQGFEYARTLLALGSVAIAQASFEYATAYAKERKQWGKYLGEHQLIQEMITDMSVSIETARFLVYRALSLIQAKKRCEREASMAKFYATEMAVEVTSKAIQIMGANGLSDEFPLERLFRDARMLTIPDGTTQIQKLIVARCHLGLGAFS
ncbi:MAG: acyl-CoA/acyl-ACP dehydrogenase [Actinobacteria bacterium]|nr:acyl-CoA/acyl-ACP dehydrogenase [Actinomycetota bacterium]MBU1945151.1 acyl-CoA/acyl-ACP dehydrogenase [Actinomycetota bacterium]MBU2686399.1 acyl-CoA/acyl-ACP dehydrogenase [Actinomycetota bacterium]